MKKLLLWSWLLCKRQLKNIILTLFLFGLPLTAFIIGRIPQMSEIALPRIAIVLTDTDEIAARTADWLTQNHASIDFVLETDPDSVISSVESGDLDCAYVFSENLTEKLDNHNQKGCITLIRSSSDFISSLSNEIVFSALFRVYAGHVAVDFVRTDDLFASVRTDAVKTAQEKYEEYVNGGATFYLDFKTFAEDDTKLLESIETENFSFPIRGILAILIFIAGLFGCVQWLSDNENKVFATVSYQFRFISRWLYAAIPVVLFGISSMFTILLSGVNTGFGNEFLKLFLYLILVTVFSVGMGYIIKRSKVMISLLPIFIVGSLILCPVFIDLGFYLPVIKVLNKLFIPYYYLAGI